MDKHPKEMTNKKLFKKLKEDGVNAKAASTVRGKQKTYLVASFFSKDE